jgi:hypothetical protein
VLLEHRVDFPDSLRGKQLWLWYTIGQTCVGNAGASDMADGLHIVVHRDDMLKGLCEQFGIDHTTGEVNGTVMAQPLSVEFAGEVGGGDGLRREWLHTTVSELVNLNRGLFVSNDGGRTLQPNAESAVAAGPDHVSYFALLGRIAGIALYHREAIPAPWSTAFVKVVLGYPLTPDDLESVDPDAYQQKVVYIRDGVYASRDGMALQDLELTFEVELEFNDYSSVKRKRDTEELKPKGAAVPVTEENKAEYLQLFVEFRLLRGIQKQIAAFKEGLAIYVPPAIATALQARCTPADIQLMLCGVAEIDVDEWQASARYAGFAADSAEVGWFWAVVREMSAAQRGKLLLFCTGAASAPAAGFQNLMGYQGAQHRFQLQLVDGGVGRLPVSHTCFNTLDLPRYESQVQTRTQLLASMSLARGFENA